MRSHYRSVLHRILAFLLALPIAASGAEQADELPDAIHQQIVTLSKKGDVLASQSMYREAIVKYTAALELLPPPREKWRACTWLLVAIGDAHFLAKNYRSARAALTDAMHCPDAIGNPFVHLRLGQVQYELGNSTRAADELARAYMGGGKEIFAPEDPKYFAFVRSKLKPPANGPW